MHLHDLWKTGTGLGDRVLDGYLPFISALLALLAGVAIGKAWERYKLRDGRWIDRRKARDSHHYVLGLNFLVANQIDLAIEELSQAARVDADALEIHLILGNVYRERGQVTRAIQVHQALLQRQKLTRLEHAYVMLCLGLDFKRGGFVDRASRRSRKCGGSTRRTATPCSTSRRSTRSSTSGTTRRAIRQELRGARRSGAAGAQPGDPRVPRERARYGGAEGRRPDGRAGPLPSGARPRSPGHAGLPQPR